MISKISLVKRNTTDLALNMDKQIVGILRSWFFQKLLGTIQQMKA